MLPGTLSTTLRRPRLLLLPLMLLLLQLSGVEASIIFLPQQARAIVTIPKMGTTLWRGILFEAATNKSITGQGDLAHIPGVFEISQNLSPEEVRKNWVNSLKIMPLREPLDRAYSGYLDHVQRWRDRVRPGTVSFENESWRFWSTMYKAAYGIEFDKEKEMPPFNEWCETFSNAMKVVHSMARKEVLTKDGNIAVKEHFMKAVKQAGWIGATHVLPWTFQIVPSEVDLYFNLDESELAATQLGLIKIYHKHTDKNSNHHSHPDKKPSMPPILYEVLVNDIEVFKLLGQQRSNASVFTSGRSLEGKFVMY